MRHELLFHAVFAGKASNIIHTIFVNPVGLRPTSSSHSNCRPRPTADSHYFLRFLKQFYKYSCLFLSKLFRVIFTTCSPTTAVPEMVYPEAAVHRPLRPTGSDGREQFREDIASQEPLWSEGSTYRVGLKSQDSQDSNEKYVIQYSSANLPDSGDSSLRSKNQWQWKPNGYNGLGFDVNGDIAKFKPDYHG
jgi:hypothetical protein